MIGIEQGPRPNSNRGVIFEAHRNHKSYAQALEYTHLNDNQGMRALIGLIEGQYLPETMRDALYKWRYGISSDGQRVLNPMIEYHRLKISEQKGGETAQMFPLLIRGFGLDEIWGITQLSFSQMHNVLSYLRREQGVLARPTQEESNSTRLQTKRIRRVLSREESLTNTEEKSFALVGEFSRAKLVPVELDAWQGLHQLYALNSRDLPSLSADKARLEVFLRARMQSARGDTNLLATYKENGDKVDSEWFDNYLSVEEEFITEILESDMSYHVDDSGVYQQDDEGNRWRPVDVVDGKLVIAGLAELRSRRVLRERQLQPKQ